MLGQAGENRHEALPIGGSPLGQSAPARWARLANWRRCATAQGKHPASPQGPGNDQRLCEETGDVVPQAQPVVGPRQIKLHVMQIGGPDAQGVGRQSPSGRAPQRQRNALNQADGAEQLGHSCRQHHGLRIGHPGRHDAYERFRLGQVEHPSRAIDRRQRQPADPLRLALAPRVRRSAQRDATFLYGTKSCRPTKPE